MEKNPEATSPGLPTRRQMVTGAAWLVPAVTLTAVAPAHASSAAGIAFARSAYPASVGQNVLVELRSVDAGANAVAVSLSYGDGIAGPSSVLLSGSSVSFFVRASEPDNGWIVASGPTGTASTTVVSVLPTVSDLRFRWQLLTTGESLHAEQFDSNVVSAARPGIVRSADTAAAWVRSMSDSGSSVWADLPLGTSSANLTSTAGRLEAIGIALQTAGSSMQGDSEIRTRLASAITRFVQIAYTPTAAEYGNWWDWQSGTPRQLLSATVFAYPSMAAADVRAVVDSALGHVTDSRFATAGSAIRMDMVTSRVLAGLLVGDVSLVSSAMSGIATVLVPVASGDGLYADGSFVQHQYVAYTGAYGADLLRALALMASLTVGSPWSMSDADLSRLAVHIENAFLPALIAKVVPDALAGRGVSREWSTDQTRAREIVIPIVRAANVVGDPYRARWRARAAQFFGGSIGDPPAPAEQTMYSLTYDIVHDSTIGSSPVPTSHAFTMMSRAILRTDKWGAIIAMSSRRTTYYEYGNDENRKGYHTGIGMVAWWGNDGTGAAQFADSYWPTVAPDAHPGITVSSKPLQDGYGGAWAGWRPPTKWGGGVTTETASAVGTVVRPLGSTLIGWKSWFLCEGLLLCLGSGIASADGYPVSTIIDNRNTGAAGGKTVLVDGRTLSAPVGALQTLSDPGWLHIEGSGGYVPVQAGSVEVLRENRTGRWSDIGGGGSSSPITRQYLRVFVDHGTDPSAGSYGYLMLPASTPDETRAVANDVANRLRVVRQDSSAHVVRFTATGTVLANFWSSTTATVEGVAVSQPLSVVVAYGAASPWMAISDAQATLSSVDITIDRVSYAGQDPRVVVLSSDDTLRLRVDLSGSYGATIVIPLHLR